MSIIKKCPVTIKNLNWCYVGNEVLRDINLTINRSMFYCIVGPNGSGKTTLLKLISKVLKTEKNKVFIDDFDVACLKNREIAQKISCVPQSTNIDFDFSVLDIVLMGRNPYIKRFADENEQDMDIVKRAMITTNTWYLKDKNINEISGGERQRVIIARALAQETDIMLLDEPVSQLDIHHQVELMDTVEYLIASRNITVISVLHDLNLAAQYSDYIILLSDGCIQAQGTSEQVFTPVNIQKAYDIDVHVMKNPVTGRPHILPLKGNKISFEAGA